LLWPADDLAELGEATHICKENRECFLPRGS